MSEDKGVDARFEAAGVRAEYDGEYIEYLEVVNQNTHEGDLETGRRGWTEKGRSARKRWKGKRDAPHEGRETKRMVEGVLEREEKEERKNEMCTRAGV